jgi:hypothetical protein
MVLFLLFTGIYFAKDFLMALSIGGILSTLFFILQLVRIKKAKRFLSFMNVGKVLPLEEVANFGTF